MYLLQLILKEIRGIELMAYSIMLKNKGLHFNFYQIIINTLKKFNCLRIYKNRKVTPRPIT